VRPDTSDVKLFVGDRVRRGKDWKWGDQDNFGVGMVTKTLDTDGWVGVKWDHGISNKYSSVLTLHRCFSVLTCAHSLAP
jgi:hypothetical protein